MSRFRHPHLTRGTVYTRAGAFEVRRGIVDVPDEVGEEFGWDRVDEEPAPLPSGPRLIAGGHDTRINP